MAAEDLEDDVHRLAGVLASRSALSQRATKEVVAALSAGRDGQAEAGRWYRETIAAGELAEGSPPSPTAVPRASPGGAEGAAARPR